MDAWTGIGWMDGLGQVHDADNQGSQALIQGAEAISLDYSNQAVENWGKGGGGRAKVVSLGDFFPSFLFLFSLAEASFGRPGQCGTKRSPSSGQQQSTASMPRAHLPAGLVLP